MSAQDSQERYGIHKAPLYGLPRQHAGVRGLSGGLAHMLGRRLWMYSSCDLSPIVGWAFWHFGCL